MWAIRRASYPLRTQNCCILFNCTFYTNPGIQSNSENILQHSKGYIINGACHMTKLFSYGDLSPEFSLACRRNHSSHVRTTSSDNEDDSEDGFSDLEVHPKNDKIEQHAAKDNDELFFDGDTIEEDGDGDDEDTVGLPDIETDRGKEPGKNSRNLLKAILDAPRSSLDNVLDQWVRGNPLGQGEMSLIMLNLRKFRLYGKALQFMEWVDKTKCLDYKERDYASHLDLIAKIFGLQKAESYLKNVPESFRGEFLYRTLLTNCVSSYNVKKSEEVFNKMRDLGFPISIFSYNQLILLYKRVDRKKVGDVLKLMEKEDVKPSRFTYRLLIDIKGRIHDISGMEDIIMTMKAEGIIPDLVTQSEIARHYIFAGKSEKAGEMLRTIEGDDITKNRPACIHLLPLYAALGRVDDVGRIWKVCEGNPSLEECSAAINAWGKLGKVEDAERVFEKMMKSRKRLPPKYYNVLLQVYADHKLLSKGEELAKRMSNDGCMIGPQTWDALVRLYVETDEVEKADSVLRKASGQKQLKPFYYTYVQVLEKYSERGDIHNSEKLFHWLRRIGYVGRMRQYQLLLQAYVNAKTPAYGFRERMKADNIFPNKAVVEQMQALNAFRKA